MLNWIKSLALSVVCIVTVINVSAQNTPPSTPNAATNNGASNPAVILGADPSDRVITTGVPFLLITPDSRAGAMGDAGVATSPDPNSVHWNAAKLAFLEDDLGVSFSFTPWLAKVINDMSISYLSVYKKINREQALALSMRYFDLGDIQLTDATGNPLQLVSPREFSIDGTFSMRLTEELSAGVTGRFIYSNLLAGASSSSGFNDIKPGVSGAADIGLYYTKDFIFNGSDANLSFGANISNIGAKITYLDKENANFLPTNLRLGTAFTTHLDPYNKITLALDFNKLMVPSPPIYAIDSTNRIITDANGNPVIEAGKDPNRGLLAGMFGSFGDAPNGFSEEMQEISIAFGAEYWYNDLFAVRAGYFYENPHKGDRQYFTAGLGLRYQVFGVDFAYLVAPGRKGEPGQSQANPLSETLRITLMFNMNTERQESVTEE
jgi:hypothetical protein